MSRRAKIVATIGPASRDAETVAAMAAAGMDVARVNTSHTDPDALRDYLAVVDDARDQAETPLAAMVDLQGPEIRTAPFEPAREFAAGDTVRFVPGDAVSGDDIGVSVDLSAASTGDRILLDDGQVETTVSGVEGDAVTVRVETGGTVAGQVGVHVPGVDLDAPIPTEGDLADIAVAAEEGADFVAASFVRDAEDVYAVRGALEDAGVDIPVVAKVERTAAVDNLDGIIDAAFGVMVARGDLGVECPLEQVPTIQKDIIRACRAAGVPVITATEMLESMVERRRPTRAEASDVANAVLDGTDAAMLSGETAIGDHPVHVVRVMDTIVDAVERSDEYRETTASRMPDPAGEVTESLARSARTLAEDVGAAAIVVESESGYTARRAAKFRPPVPIVTITPDAGTARQLALTWGVDVRHASLSGETADALVAEAVDAAMDGDAVAHGDSVVVLSGMFRQKEARTTDMLKVHVIADRLAVGDGVVPGHGTGETVRCPDGDVSAAGGDIALIPAAVDGAPSGDLSAVAGVVYGRRGVTTPVARAARDAGVPLVAGVDMDTVPAGETVTVDAVRGVVYAGRVSHPERRRS